MIGEEEGGRSGMRETEGGGWEEKGTMYQEGILGKKKLQLLDFNFTYNYFFLP